MENQLITKTFIDKYEDLITKNIRKNVNNCKFYSEYNHLFCFDESIIDYFYDTVCETDIWNSHLYETFELSKNKKDFDLDKHAKDAATSIGEEYEDSRRDAVIENYYV